MDQKRCETRGRERSTISGYRALVGYHINPYLGRTKLCKLDANALANFEDALLSGAPAPGETKGTVRS